MIDTESEARILSSWTVSIPAGISLLVSQTYADGFYPSILVFEGFVNAIFVSEPPANVDDVRFQMDWSGYGR